MSDFNDPEATIRCAKCKHAKVCKGCRIRAEVVSGNLWGDDPACYLTDEEIGLNKEQK